MWMKHAEPALAIQIMASARGDRLAVVARGLLATLFALVLATTLSAEDDESVWSTDAESAARTAREEQRDLLLLFTGSDWCPPCIKLEQQILGQPEFQSKAPEEFVLVKFDFPQNTPLPQELEVQNNAWASRFGIEGFPTVVLLDQDLKPYAFTGFRDEGPQAYLTHLGELQKTRKQRDEFLTKADGSAGLDRARLLDQALSALDPLVVEVYYSDIVEEIGELDPDDEAGLRTRYFAERDREMRKAIMSNIAMVARLREPAEAVTFIEETLARQRLPVDMWLVAQTTRLRLLRELDRVDEAHRLVDEMSQIEGIDSDTRQRLIINKSFYMAGLGELEAAFAELERQIQDRPENLLLIIAQGELRDSLGQYRQAITSYDKAIVAAAARPEVLVEVIGAKADSLVALQKVEDALQTLDSLADDEAVPGRLRAEALLHKSLILRENGRRRAAILSENRAVEVVDSAAEKSGIQKLVDQLRRKFEETPGGR
jgi:thioredoxin-related protein